MHAERIIVKLKNDLAQLMHMANSCGFERGWLWSKITALFHCRCCWGTWPTAAVAVAIYWSVAWPSMMTSQTAGNKFRKKQQQGSTKCQMRHNKSLMQVNTSNYSAPSLSERIYLANVDTYVILISVMCTDISCWIQPASNYWFTSFTLIESLCKESQQVHFDSHPF